MARLAVVLGSGGARGYAHIGALEVAEERGHEVVAISGSSMGALVGGLTAAGKLGQFTVWVTGMNQFDVLRMLDPAAVGSPGLVNAKRVTKKLSDMLEGVRIEDLKIPYTAVATDLGSRREVWFQRGPLDVAIRASIAMPSFITPVLVGDRLMVDGGVVNPLPIEPTLAVPADGVLAVDLNGPSRARKPEQRVSTPLHATADATPSRDWLERFRRGAAELLDQSGLSNLVKKVEPDQTPDLYTLAPAPKDLTYVDLATQTVDLMGSLITRYRSASNQPDIMIRVPHDACRVADFHRAPEMIALGRRLATEAFDAAGY